MNIVTWLSDKILQRISTIIGTSIITNVERSALHSHLDAMEKTEERAKELEANGNPRLAEYLRSHSEQLSLNDAGSQVQAQVANLCQPLGLPFEENEPARITNSSDAKTASETPKKKRGRPKKTNATELTPPDSNQQELE